jgi:hypothetical protein
MVLERIKIYLCAQHVSPATQAKELRRDNSTPASNTGGVVYAVCL